MLGFTIILTITSCVADTQKMNEVTQNQLISMRESDDRPIIIDVRTVEEFKAGHIPSAINIPHNQVESRPI